MRLTTSAHFNYTLSEETTFFLNFLVSNRGYQKIVSEKLSVTGNNPVHKQFSSGPGQERVLRIVAPPGELTIDYNASVKITPKRFQLNKFKQTPIKKIGGNVLPFLFPSRYCPSDKMREVAGELFGSYTTPWETAVAISDWIFENIEYVAGVTFEQTAADEVYDLRKGVCRDFAHLSITFCRALNIPARYVSVYSWNLVPMDFHAVFEAWIGGRWIIFDPTRMSALNALVRIASGRDAAFVAVATIFGNVTGFNLNNNCTSDAAIQADLQPGLVQKGELISLIAR